MPKSLERRGARLTARRLIEATRNPRAAAFKVALRVGHRGFLELVTARPRSFDQRLRYKMVRDRRPILADFADKLRAKDIISRSVGSRYAVPTIVQYDDASQIREQDLPNAFAMKVSHASGGVVLVGPDAPAEAELPSPGRFHTRHRVRRERFDLDLARTLFASWLAMPYGVDKGEWTYGVHEPKILVEPLLTDSGGAPPRDVKFFVFRGRCAVFRIDLPCAGRKSINHYLPDGTPLPVRFGEYHEAAFPVVDPPPASPETLREMLDVAERIGDGEDFLRVDTLDLGDRFYVGELTSFPTNGTGRFIPGSFDRWLGSHWTGLEDLW